MFAILLKVLLFLNIFHRQFARPPRLPSGCSGPASNYRFHHPHRWTPEIALATREKELIAKWEKDIQDPQSKKKEIREFYRDKRCFLDYVQQEKEWDKEVNDVLQRAFENNENTDCALVKAFFEKDEDIQTVAECDGLMGELNKYSDYVYMRMIKGALKDCINYLGSKEHMGSDL